MRFRQANGPVLAVLAVAAAVAGLARHVILAGELRSYRLLMIAWTAAFAYAAAQWLISVRDRPRTVTRRQQAALDRLHVAVSVPVYNEDPELLDRCLHALAWQSRPPERVDIVDDGSGIDYTVVRAFWEGRRHGIWFRWVRQDNAGKKHAQAVTFTADLPADIFVTVDSDTALEARAIDEGLKPFADPEVMSVAGIELAFNAGVNWLTRSVSARSLFFQLVACAAQSVFGGVLVNRGAFALYRAPMVRQFVPAYLGETFAGRAVKLGDDAALTLFAQVTGKAVQQATAFALTMYPETLSHHVRQWIRWMRGSTIRNCWRLRYLPAWSWGWWFTAAGTWLFLTSTLAVPVVIATWPGSERLSAAGVAAMVAWSYLSVLRVLAVHRSDESRWSRAATVLTFPGAVLWAALVLRPLRFWGIATCLRQGWTTRGRGAEVSITAGVPA